MNDYFKDRDAEGGYHNFLGGDVTGGRVEVIDDGDESRSFDPEDVEMGNESAGQQNSLGDVAVGGVEVMDDGDEPRPFNPDYVEMSNDKIAGRVEEIVDSEPYPSHDAESCDGKKLCKGRMLEEIDDDDRPLPFDPALHDNTKRDEKIMREVGTEEVGGIPVTISRNPQMNADLPVETTPSAPPLDSISSENEGRGSRIEIPQAEAYLVEEQISASVRQNIPAAHAEPLILIPWWKQKKTQFLLALVLVAVAVAAVVGVLSSKGTTGVVITVSPALSVITLSPAPSTPPTTTSVPSSHPSTAVPTSYPSDIPTEPEPCELQISSGIKKLRDIPSDSSFAVDGNNMIVVSRDAGSSTVQVDFLEFETPRWTFKQRIEESGVSDTKKIKIAISGDTALVSLPSGKNINAFVYQKNSWMYWERQSFPSISKSYVTHFGLKLNMGGNLTVVTGQMAVLAWPPVFPRAWVFRQDGGELKYTTKFDIDGYVVTSCYVAGNTIALGMDADLAYPWPRAIHVYNYYEEIGSVDKIQEIISKEDIWGINLSEHYLVYLTQKIVNQRGIFDIFIHHRQYTNGSFNVASQQKLDPSELEEMSSEPKKYMLDIYEDILVIAPSGSMVVYVYKLQDGQVEDFLIVPVDWRWPSDNYSIRVSGRNVIAIDQYGQHMSYFSIEDCFFGQQGN